MASSRERVCFPGKLRGEGREADCTVWATRVDAPGNGPPAYVEYAIKDVSKPLPEGNYTVSTNGEAIPVRYHGGYWVSRPG